MRKTRTSDCVPAGLALLAASFLLVSLGSLRLFGQAATATVQGTVTDASGAAVPDAKVTIKNTGTGATVNATSNAQGRFIVSSLNPGSYDLDATKTGFQTAARKGVTLNVGAEVVIDFTLQVGQQTQTVTVESTVTQVETTNATVGQLTDQRQMQQLPLNGRNFEQLIQLSPGVNEIGSGGGFQSSGFQGRANEYSIAGQRPIGQALLLDDENLQNFWNKGMGSVMGTSLGVEAIGEFQTLTNTYSAQFGGNGGVVNAVSKSGTNSFHGSAYEFLRNSALDARQFIDPATIPAFRQNQFGGSVGGPIKKDKLFFFVNYEGVRLTQGESKLGTVTGCRPDDTLPGLAALGFGPNGANCQITATNPTAATSIAETLRLWPVATTIVNGQPEALTSANRTAQENYVLSRFDWNISDKDSLFARYISDKSSYVEPYGGGGFAGGAISANWPEQDFSHTQFGTVEWRHILSPTLVNVARLSYSRPGTNEYTTQGPASTATVNGVDPLQFFGAGAGRQDGIVSITGLTGLGGALQLPFNTTQNRYTEADDITWTRGSHNIRMGAAVSRLQSNTFMPFFDGGEFSYNSLSQFLSGVPTALLYVPLGSYPNRDFRDTEVTPYVQDDWKVTSKLTLNLGLRWEFVTNPVDAHNDLYYVTNVATAVAPYYTHLTNSMAHNPSWHNWDPRVGLAFDPFNDHKTSIRAGFGIFHDPIGVNNIAPGFWAAYPWAINVLPGAIPGVGARFPFIPALGAPNVAKPSSQPGWDYYLCCTPYVIQYNLNVQREIAPNTILTVGYVGSRGVHLLTGLQANPPLVCTEAQGPDCANPSYANGYATGGYGYYGFGTPGNVTSNPNLNNNLAGFPNLTSQAYSTYNSALVTLNKRFSHDFQALASYTYSHCLDDGAYLGSFNTNGTGNFTNPYNLGSDKADCSHDIPHTFKINGVWALPFHGNRLVSGWQLSGIVTKTSGLVLNIADGYDEAAGGTPVGLSPRPNYVSGCNVQVGQVNEWFNPACFTLEAPGTLGDLGRNTVRGPGFFDTDLAVLKDTKINERMNLQFRAEFFNIFNHTNFGLPSGMGGVSLYSGCPTTSCTAGTSIPSAPQITVMNGIPRQIQFALKLIF